MKKRIFGLLLALCLIVGLLPVVSLAAEPTQKAQIYMQHSLGHGSHINWEVTKGGKPLYATNTTATNKTTEGEVQVPALTKNGANEDNYTLKFDFSGDKPILYLRGADLGRYDSENILATLNGSDFYYSDIGTGIWLNYNGKSYMEDDASTKWIIPEIVVEKDSQITTLNSAIRANGDVTIKSVNGAKLSLTGGAYAPATIELKGAGNLILDNATVFIECIPNLKPAVLTAEGYSITVKNSDLSAKTSGRVLDSGKDVIITDSKLDLYTNNMTSYGVINAKGDITIKGGESKLVKPTAFSFGDGGLNSAGKVTIEGGTHLIQSDNGAIKAEGGITFKEANVEMSSKNSKITNRFPVFEYACYELLAGKNEKKAEPFYGADFTGIYYAKIYAAKPEETQPKPTTPPATQPAATQPADTQPVGTTATQPKADDDATTPNAGSNSNGQDKTENKDDNSTLILVIAAAVLIVGAGAAAAIIIIKKKKG